MTQRHLQIFLKHIKDFYPNLVVVFLTILNLLIFFKIFCSEFTAVDDRHEKSWPFQCHVMNEFIKNNAFVCIFSFHTENHDQA